MCWKEMQSWISCHKKINFNDLEIFESRFYAFVCVCMYKYVCLWMLWKNFADIMKYDLKENFTIKFVYCIIEYVNIFF